MRAACAAGLPSASRRTSCTSLCASPAGSGSFRRRRTPPARPCDRRAAVPAVCRRTWRWPCCACADARAALQVAERALAQTATGLDVHFLGNAPAAHLATAKETVFFMRASYLGGSPRPTTSGVFTGAPPWPRCVAPWPAWLALTLTLRRLGLGDQGRADRVRGQGRAGSCPEGAVIAPRVDALACARPDCRVLNAAKAAAPPSAQWCPCDFLGADCSGSASELAPRHGLRSWISARAPCAGAHLERRQVGGLDGAVHQARGDCGDATDLPAVARG